MTRSLVPLISPINVHLSDQEIGLKVLCNTVQPGASTPMFSTSGGMARVYTLRLTVYLANADDGILRWLVDATGLISKRTSTSLRDAAHLDRSGPVLGWLA